MSKYDSLNTWLDYLELFLAFDCLMMLVYNLYVMFKSKVYQSYSTFAIILSCSAMLICRIPILLYYACFHNLLYPAKFLFLSSLITDLPAYLFWNITLALIWQWGRIAGLLTRTEEELLEIKTGRSGKKLIGVQICLLVVLVIDLVFLILHYKEDFWTSGQKIDKEKFTIEQDWTWLMIRLAYKLIQMVITLVFLFASIIVFSRVIRAVRSEPDQKQLQKQVYIFTVIFLVMYFARTVDFFIIEGQWIDRNLVKKENYIAELDPYQEQTTVVVTAAELLFNFYIMVFLFLGNSKNKEEEEEEEKEEERLRTQTSSSSQYPPYTKNHATVNKEKKLNRKRKQKQEGSSKIATSPNFNRRLTCITEEKYLNASEVQTQIKRNQSVHPDELQKFTCGDEDSNILASSQNDNLYLSQSQTDRKNSNLEHNPLRQSNKTIDASDEDSDDARILGVDRNNNVITSNMFSDAQSEQESLDLGLHTRFPTVRQRMGDCDSDSEISDAYTNKDSVLKGGSSNSNYPQQRKSFMSQKSHQPCLQSSDTRPREMGFDALLQQRMLTSQDAQRQRALSVKTFKVPVPEETKRSKKVKYFIGPACLLQKVNKLTKKKTQVDPSLHAIKSQSEDISVVLASSNDVPTFTETSEAKLMQQSDQFKTQRTARHSNSLIVQDDKKSQKFLVTTVSEERQKLIHDSVSAQTQSTRVMHILRDSDGPRMINSTVGSENQVTP